MRAPAEASRPGSRSQAQLPRDSRRRASGEKKRAAGEPSDAARETPAQAQDALGPSPRMLAKARRRYFSAAEHAFTLHSAHDALVAFVLSDDRELALPPVNDAQRCGLRALAAMFQLDMASRGPKRLREYAVQKTRGLRGVLPEGKAELSVARLLAAKTDCKREMQEVCDRVLAQAGLVSRREEKRSAHEARRGLKTQGGREGRGRDATTPQPPPAQPPPAPALPSQPPLRWFIDRGGGGRTPAQTLP